MRIIFNHIFICSLFSFLFMILLFFSSGEQRENNERWKFGRSYGKTFEDTSFITLLYRHHLLHRHHYKNTKILLEILFSLSCKLPPISLHNHHLHHSFSVNTVYSPSFCKSCKKEAMKQIFGSNHKSFKKVVPLNLTAFQNRPKSKGLGGRSQQSSF